MGKLSIKSLSLGGLVIVLGSEFLLRDVFISENAGDLNIGIALTVEWFILLTLLTFWIPKIEKGGLESVGLGSFKRRHLWIGIITYIILLVCWAVSGLALKVVGLEG